MADADRPLPDAGFADPDPDRGESGEWPAEVSEEHFGEWAVGDTGEWTERIRAS